MWNSSHKRNRERSGNVNRLRFSPGDTIVERVCRDPSTVLLERSLAVAPSHEPAGCDPYNSVGRLVRPR